MGVFSRIVSRIVGGSPEVEVSSPGLATPDVLELLYHLGALESRGSRMTGAISKYDLVNNSRSQ